MNYNHKQNTLNKSITVEGIGLHSGGKCQINIIPAPVDFGIKFLPLFASKKTTMIEAHYSKIICTKMCSKIGEGDTYINTIEHLMSALFGSGIDNALITVDGQEIPAMDGSSYEFNRLISDVGLLQQDKERSYLFIKNTVSYIQDDVEMIIKPKRGEIGLDIDFFIDFNNYAIGKQRFLSQIQYGTKIADPQQYISMESYSFSREISSARTFGFLRDADKMREAALALGVSENNAILIEEDGKIANGPLRFPDEFVRHKILDCFGDLFLSGHRIVGEIECRKSGHRVTAQLLKKLLSDSANYYIGIGYDWRL